MKYIFVHIMASWSENVYAHLSGMLRVCAQSHAAYLLLLLLSLLSWFYIKQLNVHNVRVIVCLAIATSSLLSVKVKNALMCIFMLETGYYSVFVVLRNDRFILQLFTGLFNEMLD